MSDPQETRPLSDPAVITMMTTEHFTLQTARSATISDANGRSSLFMTAVSSALVALAFIGQVSNMGQPFVVFSLVLLPCLGFLGLTTFVRLLQTAIEDVNYGMEISRIRHYYTEIAPDLKPYFLSPIHDDMSSVIGTMGPVSRIQILLTNAGVVSVINGVLFGVFVCMLLGLLISIPPLLVVIIGVVMFIGAVVIQTRYQSQAWRKAMADHKPMFPNDDAKPSTRDNSTL